MRIISINRAHFCDYFDIEHPMLTACSSILTSRKRKLRELFAVATDEDGLPSYNFSNPDAPPATPAEKIFLTECDISLYVPLSYKTPVLRFLSCLHRVK